MEFAQLHQDRVRKMTLNSINQRIDQKTHHHIQQTLSKGPKALRKRLKELDAEWDVDRALMLGFSMIVLPQLFAARKDRRWLLGPTIQTPFLFMHATMGWCPPMMVLRALGFRTRKEIQAERDALLFAQRNHEIQIFDMPT